MLNTIKMDKQKRTPVSFIVFHFILFIFILNIFLFYLFTGFYLFIYLFTYLFIYLFLFFVYSFIYSFHIFKIIDCASWSSTITESVFVRLTLTMVLNQHRII